jgi:hypothetical protein
MGVSPEGVIVARVRVRLGPDAIELIAHELEHVLERVEGVKYLMDVGSSKASVSGGAFETPRAIDAGRRVAVQVEHAERAAARAKEKMTWPGR